MIVIKKNNHRQVANFITSLRTSVNEAFYGELKNLQLTFLDYY